MHIRFWPATVALFLCFAEHGILAVTLPQPDLYVGRQLTQGTDCPACECDEAPTTMSQFVLTSNG